MSERIEGLRAEISRLLKAGLFTEAVPLLDEIYRATGDLRALSSLSVAYLRSDQLEKARDIALKALELGGESPTVLDALTEIYGRLRDLETTIRYGKRSLAHKDKLVCAAYDGPLSAPRPSSHRWKKLISFSLYGAEARYCEGAVLNVEAARAIYPGFICRFYIDEQVPDHVRARLQASGAELVPMGVAGARATGQDAVELPGMMWRFLALDDPEAEIVLMRDADSLISERERIFVETWLASGLDFHVVRDWYTHSELILAGTFAARAGRLPPIQAEIELFIEKRRRLALESRWVDQIALRERLWPAVRDRTLTHDRYFGFGVNLAPNEAGGAGRAINHVGANQSVRTVTRPLADPEAARVAWQLLDGDGRAFCRYESPVTEGQLAVLLPDPLIHRLDAGEIRLELL